MLSLLLMRWSSGTNWEHYNNKDNNLLMTVDEWVGVQLILSISV